MKLYQTPPVYPGLTFEISAVTVGQRNGIVPGVIKAKFQPKANSSDPILQEFQAHSQLAVTVGQRNGIVPGVIKAKFQPEANSSVPFLQEFQDSQSVENTCTVLNYTVFSSSRFETIILTPETPLPYNIIKFVYDHGRPPSIVVDIQPCPLGFMLTSS